MEIPGNSRGDLPVLLPVTERQSNFAGILLERVFFEEKVVHTTSCFKANSNQTIVDFRYESTVLLIVSGY